MKPTKSPRRRTEASRLSRDDWLDAAFEAVVEGGFDAVRVLVLADALGVTRGSFYWHFTDHADLVASLVERWHGREIDEGRRLQADVTDDPRADLVRLLDVALARGGADVKDMRFELALRGLGRRDAAVARRLLEVDAARMALFEGMFRRLTGDAQAAADQAVMFYLAITGGIQALARPSASAGVAERIRRVIAEQVIGRAVPARRARAAAGR
ncbi:MAG: TetR/AcrR family transcriptional regulator [Burkholderiaceae bacterium]